MIPHLFIGIGNPDTQYENTYHNVGLLFIHYAREYFDAHPPQKKLTLVTSTVYMNTSGAFTRETLKKFHTKTRELLIIHDDADIELGSYKLSFGRGAGGHKGVENIISALTTKEFYRLRIGVRSPRNKKKAADFVLQKISSSHMKEITKVFKHALSEIIESHQDS